MRFDYWLPRDEARHLWHDVETTYRDLDSADRQRPLRGPDVHRLRATAYLASALGNELSRHHRERIRLRLALLPEEAVALAVWIDRLRPVRRRPATRRR